MRFSNLLFSAVILAAANLQVFAQTVCPPDGCGLSVSAIEANRWPRVQPLPIDDALLFDRDYRQIEGAFSVHNAPDSPERENFGAGYTFLTVIEQSGEWTRVGDNQWVQSEILSDTIAPSRFAGALLPQDEALPYIADVGGAAGEILVAEALEEPHQLTGGPPGCAGGVGA